MILVAFPTDTFSSRAAPRGRMRVAAVIGVVLLTAIAAAAEPKAPSERVAELAKWAHENVADGRREQLALRFEPLVAAWKKAGLTAEAEALLRVWTVADPSSVRAWKLLAAAELEAQDFVAARTAYSRAATLVDDSASHLGLALASWELGDVETAEASFKAALAREPSGLVRFQWARFLLWKGRGVQAFEEFSQLPPALQQRPEVAFLLAQACVAALSGEQQESSELNEGLERGSCDQETAVLLFEKAAVLLPEHAEVRYGLARAYLRIGNRLAARKQMEQYRDLAKRDQEEGHRGEKPPSSPR